MLKTPSLLINVNERDRLACTRRPSFHSVCNFQACSQGQGGPRGPDPSRNFGWGVVLITQFSANNIKLKPINNVAFRKSLNVHAIFT